MWQRGIISQSTYSKVERGVIDITYNKLIKLLSRLDVSEFKFQMLLDEEPDARDDLIQQFFLINYNDLEALTVIQERVQHYLIMKKDYIIQDIAYICEALMFISKERDYEQAAIFANRVGSDWNVLIAGIWWKFVWLMLFYLFSLLKPPFTFPKESWDSSVFIKHGKAESLKIISQTNFNSVINSE